MRKFNLNCNKILPCLLTSLLGTTGLITSTQSIAEVHAIESNKCLPKVHSLYPRDYYNRIGYYKNHGYEIQLLPPQDPGFRAAMGGVSKVFSNNTFHAAEGTMHVVQTPNEHIKITFDFHHLLPNGVYSLWNVSNPNYQSGNFSDAPLVDESHGPVPTHPLPGRLGGYPGLDRNWFQANVCGSANFTIVLHTYKPDAEFLLDYHSNQFQAGIKGETVFPGVLWGKFPNI